jgi:hypothetical protein
MAAVHDHGERSESGPHQYHCTAAPTQSTHGALLHRRRQGHGEKHIHTDTLAAVQLEDITFYDGRLVSKRLYRFMRSLLIPKELVLFIRHVNVKNQLPVYGKCWHSRCVNALLNMCVW